MLGKTIIEKGKKYKLVKSCKTENMAKTLAEELETKNGKSRRSHPIIDHINMPLFEGSKYHFKRFKVYIPVDWRS